MDELPPSLLRQQASRFSKGTISLQSYRDKRKETLKNIVEIHAPLMHAEAMPPLYTDTDFGDSKKTRPVIQPQPPARALVSSHTVLLSVLLFTVATLSLLPNARMTMTAIAASVTLPSPSAAAIGKGKNLANEFQQYASGLSKKKKWGSKDIKQLLHTWSQLNLEQRYTARRYTAFNDLLARAAIQAEEFRELSDVSTLSASLKYKAIQLDRVTDTLLNR